MSPPEKFNLKINDYINTPAKKREYNERHFSEAASRYDVATRMMSLGRDLAWKKRLVTKLPQRENPVCLDLACGTGDVTFMLANKYPHGKIVGLDLTAPMLDRARQRNTFHNVAFLQADMAATGLPDQSVDIITGSYAVRNAPELRQAFTEIHRILRPDGTVMILDFSKPTNKFFQRAQYQVLRHWCGLWGYLLHRNSEVHAYIATSLKLFPNRQGLRCLLKECGFEVHFSERYYLGTLELLLLQKIK